MQDALMKFDPATGTEKPYPSHAAQYRAYHGKVAWLFNPWSGVRREAEDVGSDPFGQLIVAPGGSPRYFPPEPSMNFRCTGTWEGGGGSMLLYEGAEALERAGAMLQRLADADVAPKSRLVEDGDEVSQKIWQAAHAKAADEMPRIQSGLCKQPGLAAALAIFAITQVNEYAKQELGLSGGG